MYNEDIKNQYIERLEVNEKSKETIRSLFNRIEHEENEMGTDICNANIMDYPQIILRNTGAQTFRTLRMHYNRLISYRRYCFATKNIDETIFMANCEYIPINFSQNEELKFLKSAFDDFLRDNLRYRTPEELIDLLEDNLYDSRSVFRNKNEIRLSSNMLLEIYLVLSFLGYSQDEILSVRLDDVSLSRDTAYVTIGGDMESFTDDIYMLFRAAKMTRTAFRMGGYGIRYDYLDHEFLLLYDQDIEDGVEKRAKRYYNKYAKDCSNAKTVLPNFEHIKYRGIIYKICEITRGNRAESDIVLQIYNRLSGKKEDAHINFESINQIISDYNDTFDYLY